MANTGDHEPGFGRLTGILIETTEGKHGAESSNRTIDADSLWMKSRFTGGGIWKTMVDEPNIKKIENIDEIELDEEQADIELNEEEPAFLSGTTHRTGTSLATVKIS
jgi:hypothetical protein